MKPSLERVAADIQLRILETLNGQVSVPEGVIYSKLSDGLGYYPMIVTFSAFIDSLVIIEAIQMHHSFVYRGSRYDEAVARLRGELA